MHYSLWVAIAAHQAYAGDFASVVVDKREQGYVIEFGTSVFFEIGTVAAWAVVGTTSEVDGKGYFIGKFLEHNVGSSIFEHGVCFVCVLCNVNGLNGTRGLFMKPFGPTKPINNIRLRVRLGFYFRTQIAVVAA